MGASGCCVRCNLYCIYSLFRDSGVYKSISVGGGGYFARVSADSKNVVPPLATLCPLENHFFEIPFNYSIIYTQHVLPYYKC